MTHAYTDVDRFTKRHPPRELKKFMEDVQQVYSGDMTYAGVALRWGFLNKHGRPVPKLAWQMAHALFEIKIVPKEETVKRLELLTGEKIAETEELREHIGQLREARVFRLK